MLEEQINNEKIRKPFKYKQLTIKNKLEIIKLAELGIEKSKISDQYKVVESIYHVLSKKRKYVNYHR